MHCTKCTLTYLLIKVMINILITCTLYVQPLSIAITTGFGYYPFFSNKILAIDIKSSINVGV